MTCHSLQDIEANESRVTEVNLLAQKLENERHPDIKIIRSRQSALNQSWKDLNTVARYRQQRLSGAHEIQKFNRYCRIYVYTLRVPLFASTIFCN